MAINIIEMAVNVPITKQERYKMTLAPTITLIKEVPDDTVISVTKWILYEDTKETGESVELLSFMSEDGKTYSTSSPTFKEAFSDINFCMCEDDGTFIPFKIRKLSGKSKNGRTYHTCVLED